MLKHFFKSPIQTGSLIPSSNTLARELIKQINLDKFSTIVEFGPGSGALTKQILKNINGSNLYFALELNSELVVELNARFPNLTVYNDTCISVKKYLKKHKKNSADVIISSIPVGLMNEVEQREILNCISENLDKDGHFIMYMYIVSKLVKSGQRFEKLLEEYFPYTSRTKLVWNNFPPAFIYNCKKTI